MPEPELDPKDTIDRNAEQELFANLVSFAMSARILVISDKLDRGKSTLLKRLQYNCKYEIKPAIPACLVDLKDFPDAAPFALVEKIVTGLKIEDRFPKFSPLNVARGSRNFAPFDSGAATVHGKVTVKGEQQGKSAGILIEEAAVVQLAPAEWTAVQEDIAQKKCIEAFFDDLRVLCATQPIVIILDHWEKCTYDLREWIKNTFMGEHCVHPDKNLRPGKLAVVVAGNSHEKAKEKFGIRNDEFVHLFNNEQEYKDTVLSIRSLSDWDSKHVREFLEQHGYDNVSDEDIDMLRDCLKRGRTLRHILGAAEGLEL